MIPTQNHDEIRRWAARHHALPAQMKSLKFDGEPALLYFLMGKDAKGTAELEPIAWDTFFAQFDLMKLALAYDERSSAFDLVRLEEDRDQHGRSLQH